MLCQVLKQLNIIVVYHILLAEKIYNTGDAYLFLYQIQFTPMRWLGSDLLPYSFFRSPRVIPLNIIVLNYCHIFTRKRNRRALISVIQHNNMAYWKEEYNHKNLKIVRKNIIRESYNFTAWEPFLQQAEYNLHQLIDGIINPTEESYTPVEQPKENYLEVDEWMETRYFLLWLAEEPDKPEWLKRELTFQLLKAE